MSIRQKDEDKEFICRNCIKYLNSDDLINGCCPVCESDEHIFLNENEETSTDCLIQDSCSSKNTSRNKGYYGKKLDYLEKC